ncbi:DUF5677 domain-containing protein [Microbacterium sp. P02]|uniref:DUF5677 domain-containing protein n=1 Tax=Microbacterium sp. P02 TaxID=3366260 RepID=UPI00366E444A
MNVDDYQELCDLVDEVQQWWLDHGGARELRQPRARKGRKFTGMDLARLTVVTVLARHVHETARAVRVLTDGEMTTSSVPIVRSVYETALTAMWIAQSKDDNGTTAFLHENARSRAALQKTVEKTSAVFRDSAASIPDTDVTPFQGSLDNTRNFQQICNDLTPGGSDAYFVYRALSSYSHPSDYLLDLYVGPSQGSSPLPGFMDEPDDAFPRETLLYFTAMSMVWAGRAFTFISKDQTHRDLLRRVARDLQMQDVLELSTEYHQRHAKARQKARAAAFSVSKNQGN